MREADIPEAEERAKRVRADIRLLQLVEVVAALADFYWRPIDVGDVVPIFILRCCAGWSGWRRRHLARGMARLGDGRWDGLGHDRRRSAALGNDHRGGCFGKRRGGKE